jgi:hypothetical protein
MNSMPKLQSYVTMGDQTQACDIFQAPLSSGYPLPLTVISKIGNFHVSTVNSIYLIYKTHFWDFLFSEKKIVNSTLRSVLA